MPKSMPVMPRNQNASRAMTSALLLSAAVAVTALALDRTEVNAQSAEQLRKEELEKRRQGQQPQRGQPPQQAPQRGQPQQQQQAPQRPSFQQPPQRIERPAVQQQQPRPIPQSPPVVRTFPSPQTPPARTTQPQIQPQPTARPSQPSVPPQVERPADDGARARRFGRPEQPASQQPQTQPSVPQVSPRTVSPSVPPVGQPPNFRGSPPVVQPPSNTVTAPGDRQGPGSSAGDRRPSIGFAPSGQVAKPGTPIVGRTIGPPPGPTNITQFKQERRRTTDGGGRQIVQEPGNRTIIVQGDRRIIHRDQNAAIRHYYPGARSIPLPNGITQTSYIRADGMRIFTETDRSGRIVRRFGRGGGGRDIVFIDNRRFYRNVAIGAGIAAIGVGVALALAPPVIAMPRERYIVDYDRASDDDIYDALSSPPIERLERRYSLDEIRYNDTLRARMRRVDLDSITFDTGSVEITEDQYSKLERIARAMARVIERDPAETFLVEGHTDAVGDAEDNLSLSDRRAESVARVLTEYYAIPLENIVTQGYGEQHLKVDTQGPERRNRYVAVRRITPLLAQE